MLSCTEQPGGRPVQGGNTSPGHGTSTSMSKVTMWRNR